MARPHRGCARHARCLPSIGEPYVQRLVSIVRYHGRKDWERVRLRNGKGNPHVAFWAAACARPGDAVHMNSYLSRPFLYRICTGRLPVEQPTRFARTINLKTAKTLKPPGATCLPTRSSNDRLASRGWAARPASERFEDRRGGATRRCSICQGEAQRSTRKRSRQCEPFHCSIFILLA